MSASENFWNKKAEGYAKNPVSDEATYQRKLAETQSLLEPGMRVLEFGCGTGTTALHHAPKVQHIDATDISENMLAIGRERAAAAGVDNVTFSRGTLTEFSAPPESIDVVLGLNIVHLLPDREEVFAEIARILKPGGLFVQSTVLLGSSALRVIKYLAPLGKRLGLMPDVFILSGPQLTEEVTAAGLSIESQWNHGKNDWVVFMIARKAA